MSGSISTTRKRVTGSKNVNVDDVAYAYTEKYGNFNLQNIVLALKDPAVRSFSGSLVFVKEQATTDKDVAGTTAAVISVNKRETKPKDVTTVAVARSRSRPKARPGAARASVPPVTASAPPPVATRVSVNDAGDDDDDDDGDDDDAANNRESNRNGNDAGTNRKNKKQRFCGSTAIPTSAEIKACEGCQQRNAKSGCLTAVIKAGGLSAFVRMGWINHNDLVTFDMSSGLKYFGRVVQNGHATYIHEVHSDNMYTSPRDWMESLYLMNNQQLPHQDIKNACQLDLSTQCYRFVTVTKLDLNLHQLAIAFVHCHCMWCKNNNVPFTAQRPIVDKDSGMPRLTLSIQGLLELFGLSYSAVVSKSDRTVNSALAAEVAGLRRKVHDLQFSLFMMAIEQQGSSTALVVGADGNAVSSHRILEGAMEQALLKVHNIGNNNNNNNNNNHNNYYNNRIGNNNDSSAQHSPMAANGTVYENSRMLEDSRLLQPYIEPVDNDLFMGELFGNSSNFLIDGDLGNI
jgi:hypothetical protein